YSVIEAFACGKPVIASRLGGIPELVKNWQTGLLFKPGDLENLALKIRFFMKHPEKARKMGENAKEFVNNKLAKDIYYERLIKIYEELI
ncbi:MAG: glycosyltransferase family 4 protein, partial [Candidatus Nitrosocaldus sp.]